MIVLAGCAIAAAGFSAWWFDPERSLQRAVEIAEPTFIGLGTLSLVLLWAQMRQTNVWNRIITYHEYFPEIPAGEKAERLRDGVRRVLSFTDQPTFYRPLKEEDARRVMDDKGTDSAPPLKSVVQLYLNDFEEFCGAVNCGMVDDDYARELQGSRVIDAYFGYVKLIELAREDQEGQAKKREPSHGPPAFRSKFYLELQKTATRWHKQRRDEQERMRAYVEEANRRAQEVADSQGVPGKARH